MEMSSSVIPRRSYGFRIDREVRPPKVLQSSRILIRLSRLGCLLSSSCRVSDLSCRRLPLEQKITSLWAFMVCRRRRRDPQKPRTIREIFKFSSNTHLLTFASMRWGALVQLVAVGIFGNVNDDDTRTPIIVIIV